MEDTIDQLMKVDAETLGGQGPSERKSGVQGSKKRRSSLVECIYQMASSCLSSAFKPSLNVTLTQVQI